jgi:hypothetical protein
VINGSKLDISTSGHVSMGLAATRVGRRVDRNGHETELTVSHAPFGDDSLCKVADLGGVAAKHRDLEARIMVEMDVHCRDLMVMMLVVRIRQPFRQFAGMVVEDIGQRRNALSGDAVVDARPLEAETSEIANGLRAVVVPLAFHERRQLRRKFVGHADCDPLHETASPARLRGFMTISKNQHTLVTQNGKRGARKSPGSLPQSKAADQDIAELRPPTHSAI